MFNSLSFADYPNVKPLEANCQQLDNKQTCLAECCQTLAKLCRSISDSLQMWKWKMCSNYFWFILPSFIQRSWPLFLQGSPFCVHLLSALQWWRDKERHFKLKCLCTVFHPWPHCFQPSRKWLDEFSLIDSFLCFPFCSLVSKRMEVTLPTHTHMHRLWGVRSWWLLKKVVFRKAQTDQLRIVRMFHCGSISKPTACKTGFRHNYGCVNTRACVRFTGEAVGYEDVDLGHSDSCVHWNWC